MNVRNLFAPALVCALVALLAVAADAPKEPKPADKKPVDNAAAQPEFKLPPGWTKEDLEACIAAGTPGKMHAHLAQGVGAWNGKTTMWMGPEGPPMTSECTTTVKSAMDGRFVKVETKDEMPGMGPYHGEGTYGYDNVSGKFVSTWLDNHGTGITTGTGELSADGKTLTWRYTFNCPLTKKPAVMRHVETMTGSGTKTLEMFGADPKSGKEYKMMRIELTRAAAANVPKPATSAVKPATNAPPK